MSRVWIGLGSNLGERAEMLRRAVVRLGRVPDLVIERETPTVETTPDLAGGAAPGAWPAFLNRLVEARTSLAPRVLLWHLLRIEAELGRRRGPLPAPRTIDLDLLSFGELVIAQADLTLPHPRLRERRFLLEPLARHAPAWQLPGDGRTAAALLGALQARTEEPSE